MFAVLALVAGFVGGIAAGYALDDEPAPSSVAAVGAPDGASGDAASSYPGSFGYASSAAAGADGDTGHGMMPVRTRLFRRDAGGYSVRVVRMDLGRDERTCDPSGGNWCPPPECMPTAFVEATVVGEWTVSHGGGPWFGLRDGAPGRVLGVVSSWDGLDEPVFGVIVRTADGVQNVRLTVDGSTDEMAPIDGLAVLVVPSTGVDLINGQGPAGAGVEVTDAAGAVVALPFAFTDQDPACIPPPPGPPPLPAPGEQPEDVASADAAVRERFTTVFGGDDPAAVERGIDDPTGLAEIRDRLKEQYPNESADGATSYEIAELVFTSPEEAAFQFRPIVLGRQLPWQLGGARVVDGEWKITRATACAMYRLGGPGCGVSSITETATAAVPAARGG